MLDGKIDNKYCSLVDAGKTLCHAREKFDSKAASLMQANPLTLDALFNAQLRYIVPMFQRLYVWQQKPQWETLWEDIVEKADLRLEGGQAMPHYLGALIIEGVRAESPREVKRFLIIDGQQRLTTLQILLCAFRDVARANGWEALARPINRFIENSDQDVMENPDEERFKLWPTLLNREVFKTVLLSGSRQAVERAYPLVKLPRKKKFEPRSNLVEAYLYFEERLREYFSTAETAAGKSQEDVGYAVFQSLKQDFCVVEIVLSDGDDSQEIFYSLNSQGRPLSQSDLLRSLIFMRAEKQKANRDEIFKKYWSQFETPFWSAETKRGGRSYSRLDLGLRYFLMAKTGVMVDARRVNEVYRQWISSAPPKYPSVEMELADFVRHGDVYQQYESAMVSALPSTDLRRILMDFDVSTALPLVLYLEVDAELSPEELSECFGMLQSFLARRMLTGGETKEYNIFFVDVLRSVMGVTSAQVPQALRAKLLSGRGSTRHWPTDEEVLDAAMHRPIGHSLRAPTLRIMLERIEIHQRNKKTEDLNVQTLLQVEHVMPVSWGAHWTIQGQKVPAGVATTHWLAKGELATLSEPIRLRNNALQTLGNLTLVNKYLNPSASNGDFDTKRAEYKNSVLRLNRYFDELPYWDESTILARGKQLGMQFCAIWPRPAS